MNPKFSSFFWAGFECTYSLVEQGERFDLLAASGHDIYPTEDFQMLKGVGMRTAREGLAWHQIDRGNGVYDFSRFRPIMKAAKDEGIQLIWDLNHFDYPEHLDVFSPEFVTRFVEYSKRALACIREYQEGELYIVPINEISFSSWIGADQGWWYPYAHGPKNGFRLKKQLVKASIAAMKAIKRMDKAVRFIQVDPILLRIPFDKDDGEMVEYCRNFNDNIRFQTWNMVAGNLHPELGGAPEYLDMMGINYYNINQEWVKRYRHADEFYHVLVAPQSADYVPFSTILSEIYTDFKRPMVISETGSHGEFRPGWWESTLHEVTIAKDNGVPIFGVCAYPILDKPSSVHFLWPQSGLWDFAPTDPKKTRWLHKPTFEAIEPFIEKYS